MKILMLGNSYIFTNDLPEKLAELTGATVVRHTRGGAHLAEQLNPETKMGAKTLAALTEETWDYVVLQEFSSGPVKARERFLDVTAKLCAMARDAWAVPVLYVTWAYQKEGPAMAESGFAYDEMYQALQEAYRGAAARADALVAEVGTAFYERSREENLYAPDGTHPNEAGTAIAAEIIAAVILEHEAKRGAVG